jgi:predicted dehydrogenase
LWHQDLVNDPDVDVMYVATPHPGHYSAALLAVNAGKAVLVEKPFAMDAAQARDDRRRARAGNVPHGGNVDALFAAHLAGA